MTATSQLPIADISIFLVLEDIRTILKNFKMFSTEVQTSIKKGLATRAVT